MKPRFLRTLLFFLAFSVAGAFAQDGGTLAGIRTPLFLGGALGFGSGTGVGASQGLGLRQIEPMIGVWYPGLGFLRVGYGFLIIKKNPMTKSTR